jgi:hypothetical protein
MQTLITGYKSFPGEHCGSVAMRGLLHHYCGLDLPEDVVFGLGAGLGVMYLSVPALIPGAVAFGRTPSMEVDLAAHLGVDYAEQPEPDDERAWQDVREEVLAGRPTMLTGDIFYLDYRDYKVHFPAHRFVLLGFDDEKRVVQIADRIRAEPEVCSYGALFASRNPPEGMSTSNLWGRFRGSAVKHDLGQATRAALATCTRRMLGEEAVALASAPAGAAASLTSGVAGIRRLAEELPGWAELADPAPLASYNAACIEKFGNGGGNFRRMYARFLAWARARDAARVPAEAADLAWRAADGWTALAHHLWAAAGGEDRWRDAAAQAAAIADTEQELFEGLARAGGAPA